MADQDDEDLRMALRMSMQTSPPSPPEPKRSKPRDNSAHGGSAEVSVEETPEAKSRRLQRELMVAAAEKRIMAAKKASPAAAPVDSDSRPVEKKGTIIDRDDGGGSCRANVTSTGLVGVLDASRREEISVEVANQLFSMIFGAAPSKQVLGQWTNQGIRFSPDPETSMGLVQHKGGPCGVLAAIQGFVLKYLLFAEEESSNQVSKMQQKVDTGSVVPDKLAFLTEDRRKRALVKSMGEILFRCGNNKRAVIATLGVLDQSADGASDGDMNEVIAKALEGLSFESAFDLQKTLRITTYTSYSDAIRRLEEMIPVFHSRMGAMLFLVSALVSRGLDAVQTDRDDPSVPFVTAPFGHASQEVVNLLLCGEAVANLFDDKMDMGGGMLLKGISKNVEVGCLSYMDHLQFLKVGQNFKCPRWPIWVVGSESHYTVLFALEQSVQDINEIEERESQIRKAFDSQDQSGGGGFISVEGFHQVLREANIKLPPEKVDHLCSSGFIVWSELWQVLLGLDKNLGGLKDSSGLMGKKVFDLYHFNGIAKSVSNSSFGSNLGEGEITVQRPRLTKLRVSVPPKWTPEEYLNAARTTSGGKDQGQVSGKAAEPSQDVQLVHIIKTRWPGATCSWVGDPPSTV